MSSVFSPPRSTPPSPQKKGTRWQLWFTAVVLVVAIIFACLLASEQKAQEGFYGERLFPLTTAYNFTMLDDTGKVCHLDQFRGKTVYYLFGYTHCPNICPTSLTNLAAVYQKLSPQEKTKVRILFQTVDPGRDTPAALKDYASFFGPEVIGLTGEKAEIDRTISKFGGSYELVPLAQDPKEYTVNHSAYIYLIGPTGQEEVLYSNEQVSDTDRMLSDLRKILRRSSNN